MTRKIDPDKPKAPRKPRARRTRKSDATVGSELAAEAGAESALADHAASRRRALGIFLFVLIVSGMTVGGGAIAACRYLQNWAAKPYGAVAKLVEIKIAPGTSFMETSAQLATEGLVSDENYFRALAFMERKHNKIQAGVYRIKLPITPNELIAKLQSGSFQGRITIPEGWTSAQIDAYLFENNRIAARGDWLRLAGQSAELTGLAQALPAGSEGFCFPDTYMIDEGASPEKIRQRMLDHFSDVWNSLDPANRDSRSQNLTMLELITLASIVERETRVPEELPRVASVFLNRLEKHIKLQSCATVHYALGEVWSRKLTYQDLKIESAFNTYKNSGLPPSPIGNPGRGAIAAVLRPAQTDDLYFVHRGDGTHEFTKTYREHQKAAAKYRKSDPHAALITED